MRHTRRRVVRLSVRPSQPPPNEPTPVRESHPNHPVWRARDNVLYRGLVDGGLVYDSRTRRVHHLNASAAVVWEACEAGGPPGDLVRALCDHFQVDEATARADVEAVLATLASEGLVSEDSE